ncbi:sensor histidine kinase [Blastopirellula marina]|uniref:histidine kinase n=1 Tax=Blastopirellula marina TaxID=124 RepID=A0A2S8EZ75_9BACT|nr:MULTISPECIES: ATP-binding protein [Pirellulaceae]PQO25225.1 sensor histidine kinase [Blastopirellula marina]RCS41658.1 sensor histidine kinase [Bremerella cremea]
MPQTSHFDNGLPLLEGRKARLTINTAWLIKLRWVAAFGQWITIATAMFVLGIEIRWQPLATIIFLTASSNLLLTYLFESLRSRDLKSLAAWETLLFAVMLMDLGFLTAMLYFTGGITNPFAVFYLVNLALAAIVLTPKNTGILALVTVGCIGLLLLASYPLPLLGSWKIEHLATSTIPVHDLLAGTAVALVTCAMVVVYFTTRLNVELQRKEANLRLNEMKQARSEKLEALGTLAAGAAHELSTPLATIAVVAKEVQRELTQVDVSAEIKEDISLIRSELDRCRAILDQMSTDAGQATGEPIVRFTAGKLLEEVTERMDIQHRSRINIDHNIPEVEISAPLHLLSQAIRGLVKNALDATPAQQSIQLNLGSTSDSLIVSIRDRGMGMPPHILARIGEPFFTTKEPGSGTGLGVFLAKNVVEKLNGDVTIDSVPDQGTTVIVRIPRITTTNNEKTPPISRRD